MSPERRQLTFDRVVRGLITAGVIFALVWLLHYLSDVLIPFAVALLLAYLANPLVERIQRRVPNRPAAVFISLFLVSAFFVLIGLLLLPAIAREVSEMSRLLANLANNAELTQRASEYLPENLWNEIKEFATSPQLRELFQSEKLVQTAKTVAGKALPGMWSLITGTASVFLGVVGLAVILLYLIFLLLDYESISKGWKELIPPDYRKTVVGFVVDFEGAMSRYFRGQAAVAGICGVLFAVGFALVGLPLGILLGLFMGLLNMVPYLQIIGFVPAALLALFHALESGTSPWVVLGLTTVVIAGVQIVQDTVLTPKIMGKVTGLNPAMIMLSLSIWGKLLGLLGLIIALPMTFLLLVYYRRFLADSDIALKTDGES